MAARGLRRRQNEWLRILNDPEDGLIPHRLECAHNTNNDWGRDGRQRLVFPDSPYPDRYDLMYRYWVKLHRK